MTLRDERKEAAATDAIRRRALDLGSLLVAVGVGLFDYRFGIIVAGGAIAGAALLGMSKDARRTHRLPRRPRP